MSVDLGGNVLVAGSLGVDKSRRQLTLPGTGAVELDVLRIDLTGVDLFIGAGGVLVATPGSYGIDETEGTGLFVDDANLALTIATVANASVTDTRRWTGVAVGADAVSLVGLPDVTMTADNLEVRFNKASGNNGTTPNTTALDWSLLYPGTDDPMNGLSGSTTLSITADVTLDVDGYVLAAGRLGFSRTSRTGVDLGANGLLDVDLLRFDLSGVDLFIGAGAAFDTTPGSYGVVATEANATGFFVDGADLSLAIAGVTDTPLGDTRRWMGLVVRADGMRRWGFLASC